MSELFMGIDDQKLGSRITALEQLLETLEKTVITQSDKLYKEISERKKIEIDLHHRVLMENLISSISTDFINLPVGEMDKGIYGALKAAGEFTGVDKAFLIQFSKDLTRFSFTHEWTCEGIAPIMQKMQNVPVEALPFIQKQMDRKEPFKINRISDLPPEAAEERKEFEQGSVKSVCSFPMNYGGSPIGAIGLVSIKKEKEWSAEDVTFLKMFAEIFSQALKRKESEEVLQHYSSELARSNEALQQFAYIASHDLQEPLRKVIAFSGRIRDKFADALDEQGRDYLERMLNATERMQSLINDLLTFSRVTSKSQPFVSVDLSVVIKEVLSDLEVRLEQTGGSVKAEPLPAIEADSLQMRQLFQNLIGNALKFHKKEVPPAVRIYSEQFEGRRMRDVGTGGFYRIFIEDNGIGFDEKYLDRIFGVFQRLHGRGEYEGTGIGLAVCRKIVERHGGSITAKSTPDEGATFIIILPVRQSKGGINYGEKGCPDNDTNGR